MLFYQAVDLDMDSVNISTGVDTKEENATMNGRPTNLVSSQQLSLNPLGLDQDSQGYYNHDIPTPEPTPPSSIVHTTLAPVQEEKKTRWGLGRKIREKRDKK